MSKEFKAFWARDAFAYVDAYRRLLHMDSNQIEAEKRRLDDEVWNSTSKETDSRVLAQIRAVEHAQNQVLHQQEPGLVLLMEGSTETAEAKLKKAEEQRNSEIKRMQEKHNELQLELKKLTMALETRQADMVQLNQRNATLQRQLNEQKASSLVVSGTSILVVVVLLAIMFLR